MASLESLQSEFDCSICMDPADDAMESRCCHHVFCGGCSVKALPPQCPICRQAPLRFNPSYVVRRVVGNFPAVCENPGCNAEGLTRSVMKGHSAGCQFKPMRCPAPGCEFSDIADRFIEHLCTQHRESLLDNASELFRSRFGERGGGNNRGGFGGNSRGGWGARGGFGTGNNRGGFGSAANGFGGGSASSGFVGVASDGWEYSQNGTRTDAWGTGGGSGGGFSSARGCYRCGSHGHLARDCSNDESE